jgi:hypothetical protein
MPLRRQEILDALNPIMRRVWDFRIRGCAYFSKTINARLNSRRRYAAEEGCASEKFWVMTGG